MSWTKRQFVEAAYEELGLASYFFDLQPEQLNSALYRMDAMVAGWDANGISIGYPIPSTQADSSLDDDSGVPDFAIECIYQNLAVRIGRTIGKQLPPDLLASAKLSYNNMATQALYPIHELQMPSTMPRGQGSKPWRNMTNPYVIPPQDDIEADSNGPIDFV